MFVTLSQTGVRKMIFNEFLAQFVFIRITE